MKTTRRQFIAAAGSAMAALPLGAAAPDSPPTPPASRTSSGIVDCQSHLFCSEMIRLMEKRATDPRVFTRDGTRYLQMGDWLRKVPPLYTDVDAKLATMDAAGIGLTTLSINDPGPEWFGAEGPAVAQMANDFVASLAHKYPTRFLGLCVLPWQDVPAAERELDRCVRQLGMKGLLLYTNLAGRFPDEPEFRPVLARCAGLGLPVLLHPAKPVTTDVVKGYEMTSTLGNMFDNTIALTRLIMSGILDELPNLKLVCPHLGGTLPYIIGRLDHQVTVLKRGPQKLQRKPSEYLRSIHLDIVSPLPQAMKFAVEYMGPKHLLYASDHPWVEPRLILDGLRSLNLPASDEDLILRTNARQLFQV